MNSPGSQGLVKSLKRTVFQMNSLVYHIVSGQAFFTGIVLLVVAVLLSKHSKGFLRRGASAALIVGGAAIAPTSTPLPIWAYTVAIAVTVIWIFSHYVESWHRWAATATIAVWLLAAALEIPFHCTPSLKPAADRKVLVVGDSVTAGTGSDDASETWPSILAREHQLVVQDISHVGETAASALKRAKLQDTSATVVIVEIGGNDVLGSTSAKQFAEDLDALLSHLTEGTSSEDRQVIMFELPLPPLSHPFGCAQRTAAKKYGVKLVPKRVFLSVLADNHSTLDTIHLSQAGHRSMADCVWRLISSAY